MHYPLLQERTGRLDIFVQLNSHVAKQLSKTGTFCQSESISETCHSERKRRIALALSRVLSAGKLY